MSTKDKNNKKTRRDRLRQFRAGMQQHIVPSFKTITINGVVHQATDILTAIDDDITKSDAAEKGHAAWLQLVEEERASHLAVDPLVTGVEQFVRLNIGDTEAQRSVLADFGMTPHKKRAVSPKTRVVAAQKAKATRALLHTMGSNQKKEALAQAASANAAAPAAAEQTPTGPTSATKPAEGGPTPPAKP
jgi:hypothetical protein